jgi:hypothetical protein
MYTISNCLIKAVYDTALADSGFFSGGLKSTISGVFEAKV